MKRLSLKIAGSPVTVKVSKWTGRPKANGIYIKTPIATGSLSLLKECIEVIFNITIDTYMKDRLYEGLHISEDDAIYLDENTIICGIKEAEKRGWFNSPLA